jgi:ppGpp synthetase/RelA/SpoT-type nucleotidyltranferase
MTDTADDIVQAFQAQGHEFEIFMDGVASLFQKHPAIAIGPFPIVHSIKRRTKDPGRLKGKIERKRRDGVDITLDNCFWQITDFAGVRVLHLKQADFSEIKSVIDGKIASTDWYLAEQPIAYTWDPEYEDYFLELGCRCERKESFYTSVHFVVRPRADSRLSCEIQVRTLFEEIWAEIDHHLNYPTPTTSESCREQLRVLAKLVGAGSRLVSSIYRCK